MRSYQLASRTRASVTHALRGKRTICGLETDIPNRTSIHGWHGSNWARRGSGKPTCANCRCTWALRSGRRRGSAACNGEQQAIRRSPPLATCPDCQCRIRADRLTKHRRHVHSIADKTAESVSSTQSIQRSKQRQTFLSRALAMPEVAHVTFSGTTVLTVTLRDDFANTVESAGALASRLASDYAAYTHLRHAACYVMHNKTEYAKGTFWASAYEPPVA